MTKLYTFGEMKQLLNAKLENIRSNTLIRGFSIDSRNINVGDLFFCIKGENKDGHHYISQSLEKGAIGIVANKRNIPDSLKKSDLPCIFVPDPNKALMKWAADVRNKFNGKVLAITGSNGKTSTKDILASLCSFLDPMAYATPGNYNNLIGVPLTILSSSNKSRWWIIEIGTNKFGEIAELSNIVRPNAAIITSIGESHLEFLESTLGVAKEKSGLFKGMSPGSRVVIPHSLMHKELVEHFAEKYKISITQSATFSERIATGKSKFRLFNREFETSLENPLLINNLILALTLLYLEGVSLSDLQLASSSIDLSVKSRFQKIDMEDWILIDDSYNANPASFKCALENLEKLYPERRKIVVCGMMAELGHLSSEFHRQVGNYMFKCGIKKIFGLGGAEIDFYLDGWTQAGGQRKSGKHFRRLRDLINSFKANIHSKDVVLVKGSRSARMERFIDAI